MTAAASEAPDISPERLERFNRTWTAPPGVLGFFRTINNVPIAQRYMATGFLFFLAGGVLALLMRVQLGTPENTLLDAETYNQIFTMHGTTMMFLFVIPFIEAFASYMLPLLLGTRDLPFPRMTALSYWTYLFGGLFLYSSFLFGAAPDGGWFAYVPLTNIEFSPGINMDFWDIGLSVAEIAAMGAAAEMVVAVLRMRAAGMTLNRMPLFAWSMLVAGVMIIFAFTPLIVGTAMLELDRKGLTAFFKPDAGGEPLLWQHLFWVFGHPEVYIMFIPAAGIVSHVVQVFARRPLVSYPLMVLSLVATGFISFGLWVHHMFTTGLSSVAMGFFGAASLMIAIPNGIQVFGWIATLWTGRPLWRTPLLFVLGFIVIFTIGGLTGVMVGVVPFDTQAHDSYFVVAHFHYVLIGGVIFPLVAGLYYWLPKITGRLMSERLGRWNFWTMFIFFHVAFLPMHLSGFRGMARRVYTYPEGFGLDIPNLVSTVGAFGFAAGVLLLVVNFFWSLRRGEPAPANPWHADTLEWSETSPPPQAQFVRLPMARGRHPLWERTLSGPDDTALARQLAAMEAYPSSWRGALVTSVLDARPLALVHMPGPTIAPFVMAVGFVFLFAGALTEHLALLGIGALVTIAALVAWFWPRASERRAIEEMSGAPAWAGGLPLAVTGPIANGWWGMMVFLGILGTALFTLVASFYYLSGSPDAGPGNRPVPLARPVLATLCCLGIATATAWYLAAMKRQRVGRRRLGLAVTTGLTLLAAFLGIGAFGELGIDPAGSAYGSALLGLFGFQALALLITAVVLGMALLWAWRRPLDPRSEAVAWNASLPAFFSAASAAVIFTVVYLIPRVL